MNIVFCINKNEELSILQNHQIKNILSSYDHNIILIDDEINIKDHVLNKINTLDENDVILFIPIDALLLNKINFNIINSLVDYIKNNNDDVQYIRLRKIGFNKNKYRIKDNLYRDLSNSFYLVPYLIKVKTFRQIISNVKTKIRNLFWHSLETKDINGAYFFNLETDQIKQDSMTVGWKCDALNVFCGILNENNKWDRIFLQNSEVRAIMAEYNILIQEENIYNYGCCQ